MATTTDLLTGGTSSALLEALSRFAVTGPEFGGFLANHGPMAVEAMVAMQGDDAVAGWVDAYVGNLDVAPTPGNAVNPENWSDWLGCVGALGDWTSFFLRQTREADWRSMLTTWWPRLLPGLVASATHGLIRTAHAVRTLAVAGDRPDPLLTDELARGLGLWAARFRTLPGPASVVSGSDAAAALAAMPRLPAAVPSRGPGVDGRVAALDALPGFPAGLARWSVPAVTDLALTELIGAAARVLAARPDAPIPLCHTVTAPAAIRLVLPHLEPETGHASVRAAWQVVGGVVAAYGDPPHPDEATAIDLSDDEVTRLLDRLPSAALDHRDEHVIKLTEAAVREFRVAGDPMLLVAADRFRDRLAPA